LKGHPVTDSKVAQFNVFTTDYEPLPEYGGKQAILHAAEDKRRLAGSFHESGVHHLLMPYDEFIYVIAGTATISVEGGETVELGVGGCCYLLEGQNVTFDFSDDFHDVSVLVSDTPFEI
jgi:uncharacterized cupin superfamily protein